MGSRQRICVRPTRSATERLLEAAAVVLPAVCIDAHLMIQPLRAGDLELVFEVSHDDQR